MSETQKKEQSQQNSNLPARRELAPLAVPVSADDPLLNYLDPGRFDAIQRTAKMYSESSLVPEHYRGKLADCFIAFEMASRLGIAPFMFMQNTYVVAGKPGMEAKLAIALVNERGPFQGPIQWKWSGTQEADDWTCTAYAIHRQTGEVCEASVDWKMVKMEGWLGKNGSKWKTMPRIMFQYRTASFLARLYCPEVLMGMSTTDENEDIQQVSRTIITDAQPLISDKTAAVLDLRAFEKQLAELGISKAEAREYAIDRHGVDRIENLAKAQADDIIAFIKSQLKVSEGDGLKSDGGSEHGGGTDGNGNAKDDAARAAAGADALRDLVGNPNG